MLAYELEEYGLKLQTQVLIPIQYNEIVFDAGFRSDIFVEDQIIVEVKSVSEVQDAEHKQLITYLKLADKRLGILNFNTERTNKSIFRKAHRFNL